MDRQRPRAHLFAVNNAADFLLIVREVFEDEGYGVTTGTFTPAVFTQIVMRQPDVLIVDVAIDEPAVWGLLARLHSDATTRAIPMVLTSTTPELLEQVAQDGERYGHHRTMVKPLDLDALLVAVREVLGDT